MPQDIHTANTPLSAGSPHSGPRFTPAVSSWSWHQPFYAGKFSLLDVPQAAAGVGVPLVELHDFMLPAPRFSRIRRPLLKRLAPNAAPHVWRYTRGNIKRLQRALDRAGVRCICWAIETDLTVPPERLLQQKQYALLALQTAQRLGAGLVRLTLGGAPDEEKKGDLDNYVASGLVEIAALQADFYPSIQLVVENHGGRDIGRFLRIIKKARQVAREDGLQSSFGVCFDPGNVPADQRPAAWRQLARQAMHFHLKTHAFDAQGEETRLPYGDIFAMLRKAKYRGYVVIEYEGEADPAEGVRDSVRLYEKYVEKK